MTNQPQPVWSFTGSGAVNSSGLFEAGDVNGGPFQLKAVYNGVTAVAAISVAYSITPNVVGSGNISPSGEVLVLGIEPVTFTMAAAPWHDLAETLIDGVSIGPQANYTFKNIHANHTIEARFTEQTAPKGTPLWWLVEQGWSENFEEVELEDHDGDGLPNWIEYRHGTDPNDPFSRLLHNVVPYAEGFENLAGWGGGYGKVTGRMGWKSTAPYSDNSKIIKAPGPTDEAKQPLAGLSHSNILQVVSEGGLLQSDFGSGFDMRGATTYIDMAMQFAPQPELPAFLEQEFNDVKLALFVGANHKLVIYHGLCDSRGARVGNTVSESTITVTSSTWYRVTVQIDASLTNNAIRLAMFKVLVDGTPVTSHAAYNDDWKAHLTAHGTLPPPANGGTWFRLGQDDPELLHKLQVIGFGGQGFADDIVVTTEDPFVIPPVYFVITATAEQGGSITPEGRITVEAGSDQLYTITADPGHAIRDVLVNQLSVGPVGHYKFEDIAGNQEITALFQQLKVSRLVWDSQNRCWQLSFHGLPGRIYEVQYKDDLRDPGPWQPMTNFIGAGESIIFNDPTAAPSRFYRLILREANAN